VPIRNQRAQSVDPDWAAVVRRRSARCRVAEPAGAFPRTGSVLAAHERRFVGDGDEPRVTLPVGLTMSGFADFDVAAPKGMVETFAVPFAGAAESVARLPVPSVCRPMPASSVHDGQVRECFGHDVGDGDLVDLLADQCHFFVQLVETEIPAGVTPPASRRGAAEWGRAPSGFT